MSLLRLHDACLPWRWTRTRTCPIEHLLIPFLGRLAKWVAARCARNVTRGSHTAGEFLKMSQYSVSVSGTNDTKLIERGIAILFDIAFNYFAAITQNLFTKAARVWLSFRSLRVCALRINQHARSKAEGCSCE